jgi:deoxyribonuclease IV
VQTHPSVTPSNSKRAAPRRYGKHTSIAGGLSRALERAADLGCTALQIFSRNPGGWAVQTLADEEAEAFREARARLRLGPVVVHDNYLINLASRERGIRSLSIDSFRDEIERAARLGADYLVTHPGSAKTGSPADGVAACIEAIEEAADGLDLGELTILIENTAGQGGCIGRSFEEVAAIVEGCARTIPIGACLDTAHTFAAGYDLATPAAFAATMRALDSSIGFERVRVIHFNDSKVGLGANVDRHWHLGEGAIGFEALARVARFRPLRHAALILETPEDDIHDATWNLDQLRRMIRAKAPERAEFDSPHAPC